MATKNNLVKRLRREITASPKKAAVLGISFVIAIWFWAPLIGKWIGVKSSEEAAVAPASVDEAVATSETVTRDCRETDAKMAPGARMNAQRSADEAVPAQCQRARSFCALCGANCQTRGIAARHASAARANTTTSRIGTRSTVIGPHTKTALINGRAYHEQQSIVASNGRDRFDVGRNS